MDAREDHMRSWPSLGDPCTLRGSSMFVLAEYSMILVDLNGKDLLRELMSAYAGNDAISQACKSALDCIESAEALSKVRVAGPLFCTGPALLLSPHQCLL